MTGDGRRERRSGSGTPRSCSVGWLLSEESGPALDSFLDPPPPPPLSFVCSNTRFFPFLFPHPSSLETCCLDFAELHLVLAQNGRE